MLIIPQVFRIKGMSNQYLICDGSSLTLIDTGVPRSVKNILNFIESVGYKPENLKRIFITHSDPDHIGGISGLKTECSATISTSAIEADAMLSGKPNREIKPNPPFSVLFKIFSYITPPPLLIDVDTILKDGDIIPILGGLLVIATPGHTPGHLSFFLLEEKILFAGDSINSKNGKPTPNLSFLSDNLDHARKSFDRQMSLNPVVIGCGHAYFDLRN